VAHGIQAGLQRRVIRKVLVFPGHIA
jgi:hypothetical protein